MHAGTLVVRPLSVHGATQQMLQCDGNIATSQIVIQVRFKSQSESTQHRWYFRECACTNQEGGGDSFVFEYLSETDSSLPV